MITQAKLHELFDYREDGKLIWKVKLNQRIKIGDLAGSLGKGRSGRGNSFYRVSIDKKEYQLHRMIFLYHYGYLTPGMDIDHIDGNPLNK